MREAYCRTLFVQEVFAPNITLMLDFFDRTSALFATQILRQRTDHLRAAVIIHLFLVGRRLGETGFPSVLLGRSASVHQKSRHSQYPHRLRRVRRAIGLSTA